MSEIRDEDHLSAPSPEAHRSKGLLKNTDRVALKRVDLLTQGYQGSMGHAQRIKVDVIQRQMVGDRKLNWTRISIPRLYLSHTAHLLFLQGAPPVQFFISSSLMGARPQQGPLLFLRGVLSRPWEVPAYFDDLVLGRLFQNMPKISVLEVFKALSSYEAKRLG